MWRIIDTMQEFIDRQSGVRSIMCEIAVDTAADLPANTADRVFILGTFATAIDTGDIYKINSTGLWILQPSGDVFQNVYTKSDIDSMITEIYDIIAYYHTTLVSDTGEISFYSLGGNVGTWAIYGNGQQTGTPTPGNPIMPEFVGVLDSADWTIPITCAGQTVPVYLGQTQTVRRVKKLVLNGTESMSAYTYSSQRGVKVENVLNTTYRRAQGLCNIYPVQTQAGTVRCVWIGSGGGDINVYFISILDVLNLGTVGDFKTWVAQQYAAGHPVTIWYVLTEPQTAIVNEPLAKIGDYADELHSEDAAVAIPTIKGQNTLTVETILKPSKIEISGEG